jgi:hypothetical protein
MQRRSVRITVLTLLLATPLAAAWFLWTIDRRAADAAIAVDVVTTHIEQIRDALAEIGAAQQGYVAPGQIDEPWFERTTTHIGVVRGKLAAVRPLVRSARASTSLDALTELLDALEAADARARENLSLAQDLMAADVIFSDGRNVLDAMVGRLRDLQHAERAAYAETQGSAVRARWAAFGLLGLVSLAVLAVALRTAAGASKVPEVPTVAHVPEVRTGTLGLLGTPDNAETLGTPRTPGTLGTVANPDGFKVDLAAAAAVCTELSRVTETAALSSLVGRAADVLDASGLTLWMSAGEQLFPVLGHGYPAEQLARFGPIARGSDNAASTAWRTGRPTVIAATPQTSGGLVVPMPGPHGCVGVLALEIRHGREQDGAIQAVATMVAAQLATAVAAWPAASGDPANAPKARTA